MDRSLKQIDAFFNPSSVAIVGATKKMNKAGHVIFRNFVESKRRMIFKGEIYPVNLHEESILGFESYTSLTKIPGELELVIHLVPVADAPNNILIAETSASA